MSKITNNLRQHLQQPLTTLAFCWLITRRDNQQIAVTQHDCAITVDGVTYLPSNVVESSVVENSLGVTNSNSELGMVLDHQLFKREDIIARRYDQASVHVNLVNFLKPEDGGLLLFYGHISAITLSNDQFVAKLEGLQQKLENNIGQLYSPLCRAQFCDRDCGLSATQFEAIDRVAQTTSTVSFHTHSTDYDSGIFDNGLLEWIDGPNQGIQIAIASNNRNYFTLCLPPPLPIEIGSKIKLRQGCDKKFNTCFQRFHNAVNFRGEPHIPGVEALNRLQMQSI